MFRRVLSWTSRCGIRKCPKGFVAGWFCRRLFRTSAWTARPFIWMLHAVSFWNWFSESGCELRLNTCGGVLSFSNLSIKSTSSWKLKQTFVGPDFCWNWCVYSTPNFPNSASWRLQGPTTVRPTLCPNVEYFKMEQQIWRLTNNLPNVEFQTRGKENKTCGIRITGQRPLSSETKFEHKKTLKYPKFQCQKTLP